MINASSRKHFFRDEQDNRTVVETYLAWAGYYRAVVIAADNETDRYLRGSGHSRLSAIADLNENIMMSRENA